MTEHDRFERCLPLILAHEGGDKFTNDPQDPGGATRFGVTLATLQSVRGDATVQDVRELGRDEAASIYRSRYWLAAYCDRLPAGLDYMHLDSAINQGVRRAKLFLQRALHVPADGDIGPQTLLAIRGCDPVATVKAYRALREAHYRSLSTFPRFGRGWMRRLAEVEAQALAWATDGASWAQTVTA